MDFKRWWSEQEIFCGDGGMDAAELAWDYCHEEITRLRAELAEVEGQEEKLVEIIRRSYLLGVDDAAEGQAAWCRQGSEEKATELLQEMRTDADLFAHPAPAKVPEGLLDLLNAVGHVGVDFGEGPYQLSATHIQQAQEYYALLKSQGGE